MLLTDISGIKNDDTVEVECDKCKSIRTIKLVCYKKKRKRTGNDLCAKCSIDSYAVSERLKNEWSNKSKMLKRFGNSYIDKQRTGALKLWQTNEYREKQGNVKGSEKYRDKMSAAISSKWSEDNFREKMTSIMNSDEYKTKISQKSIVIAKSKYHNNFFKSRSSDVHNGKYNYSKSEYTKSSSKILVTCSKHGTFNQIANDHMQGHGCPKCSVVVSRGQQEIIDFLSSNSINVEINDRRSLDGLEIDILITDFKIGIEFNGLYWHSCHNNPTYHQKNRHKFKTSVANNRDIKLIQIWDHEWENKKEIIKSMLLQRCMRAQKEYARNLSIVSVESKDAKEFYNSSHMHGFKSSYAHYGLASDSEILMMLSFTRNQNWFEISRFATKTGYNVVGGFSRLLKHHLKNHNSNIITYCDRRFSDRNNIYEKSGFKLLKITKPNYFYYNIKSRTTVNRQSMQKHKLSNMTYFDKDLTEMQNCIKNGFYPVFDCGHYKYELNIRP